MRYSYYQGIIFTQHAEFQVTTVANEGNLVAHKGKIIKGELKEGEEVSIKINADYRKLYSRLHSAGHLLDIAFHGLGFKNEGTKGYHFPKGSYVEYAGKVDLKDPKQFIVDMEKKLKDIITMCKTEDAVKAKVYKYEESKEFFKGAIPEHIPKGADVRVIYLMSLDEGCACGGTHVNHIKDIGQIKITKAKNAGKAFRVSYEII